MLLSDQWDIERTGIRSSCLVSTLTKKHVGICMYPRVITHKKEMVHDHYTDSNKLILTWVWMLISTAKVRQSDVERIVHLVRGVVCMVGYVISCVTGRMQ